MATAAPLRTAGDRPDPGRVVAARRRATSKGSAVDRAPETARRGAAPTGPGPVPAALRAARAPQVAHDRPLHTCPELTVPAGRGPRPDKTPPQVGAATTTLTADHPATPPDRTTARAGTTGTVTGATPTATATATATRTATAPTRTQVVA